MKRIVVILMILLSLCGCNQAEKGIDRALSLRSDLLNANGCSFDAEITADFGERTYTFMLSCQADQDGNISFCVLAPEYISGIKGKLSYEGGKLTFEKVALAFDLQTDDILSPVSGPWILLRALRGGYIQSYATEGNDLRLTVNDSYQDDALMLDIWLNSEGVPFRADVFEENRRVLSIGLDNFKML